MQLGDAPQVQAMGVSQQSQDWRGQYGADRGMQQAGLDAMGTQAQYLDAVQRGEAGQSLAELQMRQGLEQSQRQALGTALAGRGGTASQIAAIRAGGDMALQATQGAAMLRAQEQAQARDAYGQMLGQRQSAAQGLGGLTAQQAGLEQGWAGQNLTAQQANQQAMLAAEQANQSTWLGARGVEADTYNAALAANAQIAQANLEMQNAKRERNARTWQTVAQAVGNLFSISDERQKVGVREAERDDVREEVEALSRLRPVEYEYRPSAYDATVAKPIAAPGERVVGFTTQDAQRAGLGGMVQDTPDGQAFDAGRAASTALTGAAQATRDVERLEEEIASLRRALGRG
ncbi:MAG: hypothetical protein WC210_08810 [Candidatus Neomarinimicrobiota bacterium]